jgi:pilus assembly protein CpaF
MTLMSGMELGVRAVREQVASALQLIVHQARMKDGSRRITHLTEIVGMEGDVITLQDLFLFDYAAGIDEDGKFVGNLKSTGLRPRFLDRLQERGITLTAEVFAPIPGGRAA